MKITCRVVAAFMLIIILSLQFCVLGATEPAVLGFDGFLSGSRDYDGRFSDVPADSWFAEYVAVSYELRLIDGVSETRFDPDGNLTLGAAIKIAACIHSIYNTGKTDFKATSPWYKSYSDYAVANKIITADDKILENLDETATRAQTAAIFVAALPDTAFPSLRELADGDIPDVSYDDTYGAAIYRLYSAGILSGNDAKGTFYPESNIKRSEIAAIITRIAIPAYRTGYAAEHGVTYTMYSNLNDDKTLTGTFSYSDKYFDSSSDVFVPEIAKVSLALSAASYRTNPAGSYIYNAMTDMGFEVIASVNFNKTATPDDRDFTAYTLGKRTILQNGDLRYIYCLCIRGTQGGDEWISNIDIGTDDGDHDGISKTAEWLYNDIAKYIDTNAEDNILWMMGHSRGGGVANLLSVLCCDTGAYALPDSIHTYTFASPTVTTNDNNINNIFNIINPGDVVTSVPPVQWGFHRYGIDIVLSTDENVISEMNANLFNMTGVGYNGLTNTDEFSRIAYEWCPQPKDFYRTIISGMSPFDIFYLVISNPSNAKSLLTPQNILALTLNERSTLNFIEYYLNNSDIIAYGHAYESYIAWLNAQYK